MNAATNTQPYVDGFLLAIPADKIEAYRAHAEKASHIWREHGALSYHECVIDDAHIEGMRSFTEAAGAKEGEVAVLAWATFASREARDEANAKIMTDPRIAAMIDQGKDLFDCTRMIYGGFKTLVHF